MIPFGPRVLVNPFLPRNTIVMHPDDFRAVASAAPATPLSAWAEKAIARMEAEAVTRGHRVDADGEHAEDCGLCHLENLIAEGRAALCGRPGR